MCNIPIDDGCPLCGDRNHRAFAEQRGVSIHLCEVCGFMFVFPPPEEGSLRSLYQLSSGYYATASENLKDTSKWSAVQLHQLLAEHGVAPGRFLEIGCSSGSLIYHLQELGWDVVGVEVNPGTARIARDNGLVVYLGTVESIVESVALKGELFDVIYLGDVIEHLPQPLQTLSLLRSVMRPGGTLILRTPNSLCGYAQASLKYAQVFRAPWYYSEAPYHLCEFTPTTLRALITRAGFTVSSLLCQPPRVPLRYTIGATGKFDELKKALKIGGRYRFASARRFWMSMPALVGMTAIIVPLWMFGAVFDKINGTYPLVAIAKKSQRDSSVFV